MAATYLQTADARGKSIVFIAECLILILAVVYLMGENRPSASISLNPSFIPANEVLGYIARQSPRVEFFCPDYRDFITYVFAKFNVMDVWAFSYFFYLGW